MSKIQDWIDANKRARKYAHQVDLVNKVLTQFEKEKGKDLSPDARELIEMIDLTLEGDR